jgi:predicted aconitase
VVVLAIDTRVLEEILSLAFTEDEKRDFIPVSSVHISGVNYYNIGDPGLEFLRSLEESGLKFVVKTTINPGCSDLVDVEWQGCDPSLVHKQKEIVEIFESMGAKISLSCTPYLDVNKPKPGDHLAWAESSAVLYANSVIGAWTNKESGISALASGILGKTAYVGVHRKECRIPQYTIVYEGGISDEVEAGALGFAVGRVVNDKIFILKCPELYKLSHVRQFLAALGTSGSAPMAYINHISSKELHDTIRPSEEISISHDEVIKVVEELSSDKEPEAFIIGCPHLSYEELSRLIEYPLSRIRLPVYSFTSRSTASEIVFTRRHENLKVIKDSCVLWCGLKYLKHKTVATNSVKAAYYLKNVFGLEVKLMSLNWV